MFLDFLLKRNHPEKPVVVNCNEARVYVGSYVVGTNESGHMVSTGYSVVAGDVVVKHLDPVVVKDERGVSRLDAVVLCAGSDVAEVLVYGRRKTLVRLYKLKDTGVGRVFVEKL